ncbi:hypothetical protein, partial [Actinacidiphila bryophytorum]
MNRRIVTIAVGLAATSLLAAGCGGKDGGGSGGGGGKDKASASSASSSGQAGSSGKSGKSAAPIVSTAEAGTILDTYEKVNNAANVTQDGAKLGTVEGGALYQQSLAQYKQFPTYSAKVKADYRKPFTYVDRHFHIPAGGSWFMVDAAVSGGNFDKGERQLIVFQQQTGGHWKMVLADDFTGAAPAVATSADGAATVVAPDATVAGTKLSTLGSAANDLRVSGGKKAGAVLADSAVRRDAVKEYTTRNDHWGRYKTCLRTDFEDAGAKWDSAYTTYPQTYAVRTADGGALVASTSYFVKLEFSTRPEQCTVVPGGNTTVYLHGDQPGVRSRFASLNAVSVPAT